MKTIYIVIYTKRGSDSSNVSSEGYNSLEDAQKFIESRSNKYKKIGEYAYVDSEGVMRIRAVNVKEV